MDDHQSAATSDGGAETSRDLMLAQFQEVTNLEDIAQCLGLLESTNWDMDQAIQLYYSGAVGLESTDTTTTTITTTGRGFSNPFRTNRGPGGGGGPAANEDDYVTINDSPAAITIEDETDTTTEKKSAFNVPRRELLNAAGLVSVSARSKTAGFKPSSLLEHLDRYQSTSSSFGPAPLSALTRPSVNQLGDDLAAYLLADQSPDNNSTDELTTSYPHRRLLEFEIEYKHKKFQLHLNDDDTVRKLKELIGDELGIPDVSHINLKGWKPKDLKVTDFMRLRELNLRRETSLFVINTDPSSSAAGAATCSSSSSGAAQSSFELLIFLLETNASHLDSGDLQVSDDDLVKQGKRTSYRLKFDASTKFLEVKRAVAKLSNVIVYNQEWWAFSKNYVPDQNTFLLNPFSSGGDEPSPLCGLSSDAITCSPVSSSNDNNKYFQDLLANNVLYSMPLSILEPDNMSLTQLRDLISTVLDPDHGLAKTATSWSTAAAPASSKAAADLFSKNSKLTPPIATTTTTGARDNEIKMSFVVTARQGSVNTQESDKSAQATSSGVRAESALGFDLDFLTARGGSRENRLDPPLLTAKSLEHQHSPLKRAKYSGLSGQESQEDDKDDYEAAHLMQQDDEHMNVDEDEEEDIDDQWVLEPSSKMKPLIPDDCPDDEFMGTNCFVEEFAKRYGPIIPLFFIGSLEDAVKDALLCPARDRKLLVIYLHSDSTVFCNIFCSKALCDESVINFLASSSCTVWPWDLTHKRRERYFNDKCSKHLGSVFASTICNSKKLPALVVVTRVRAANEVLGVIEGDSTSDLMLDRLMQYYELFDAQRVKDERDEQGREERERIKREQDAAYQTSLEHDKAKRQRQAEENEKQQQAAQQERLKLEAKERRRHECLANLPAEPDESVPAAQVARIRFRLPSGETLQRRFNISDKLKALVDFAIGNNYSIEEYKILSAWPRRDLTSESPEKTFEELKLYPQETVTLEQR